MTLSKVISAPRDKTLSEPGGPLFLVDGVADPFSTQPESDFWSILGGIALDEVMAGVAFMLLMLALLVLLGLFS